MVNDQYSTILKPSEGEYKEKGSKFLAFAFPFETEEMLEILLHQVRSLHPKARHFCYAYRIGMDMNRFRVNDDGEPSGTAGKPILGQIQSFQITNALIIVTRYFGGTKLGASGLIHAYREAAKCALSNAEIVQNYLYIYYELRFAYEYMGHILAILKDNSADVTEKSFESECRILIKIRLSEEAIKITRIKAGILHKSPEEINEQTEIPYCHFKKI